MEINIKITPQEACALKNAHSAGTGNTDNNEVLASLFCDNYCKYPGHVSDSEILKLCDCCPIQLLFKRRFICTPVI